MKTLTLVTMISLALVAVGCSKAPTEQMTAAETALAAADAQEADLYAPEAMAAARDSLEAAKALISEQDQKWALARRYGKSEEALASAERAALRARQDAEAGKARVRDEVQNLIATAQADLDSVAAMLAYAPAGKDNRADLELMKADVETMRGLINDLNVLSAQERYLEAQTKGQAIVEQLARMREELAAATAPRPRTS